MKSFKQFLVENSYEVGTSVYFDRLKVSSRMDIGNFGAFDYGKVVSKGNGSYEIELPNLVKVKINADEIISYGDAGCS